jgi:hypothetical protein
VKVPAADRIDVASAPSRVILVEPGSQERRGGRMKKNGWRRWTVERPAAFGDWLWLVLVVLPADWLDKLTWRKIIAFIPVIVLAIAIAHNVPLPPEILFLGDALAYLDMLTILLLLAAIGRVGAILYFVRQMVGNAARGLAKALTPAIRRADPRHRRANNTAGRNRLLGPSKKSDDDRGPLLWGVPA